METIVNYNTRSKFFTWIASHLVCSSSVWEVVGFYLQLHYIRERYVPYHTTIPYCTCTAQLHTAGTLIKH